MAQKMEGQLNAAQHRAVTTTEGPVLLIAGPGTGKTKTLVSRTVYLLEQQVARPEEITVTTFTRKAAAELRSRVTGALAKQDRAEEGALLHIGNFHALAMDIVSYRPEKAGLTPGFRVLDETEPWRLLEEHRQELCADPAFHLFFANLAEQKEPWKKPDWQRIQRLFDRMREGFYDLTNAADVRVQGALSLLDRYRSFLRAENALDFSGLLDTACRLLEEEPTVRENFQRQCRYLMVDEYQDTNPIQERILRILAKPTGNLCVVGDDDQSLYRFRGARVENLLHFGARYPGTTTILLEENYRSDGRILQFASSFLNDPYADLGMGRGPRLQEHRFRKYLISAVGSCADDAVQTLCAPNFKILAQQTAALIQKEALRTGAYHTIALLSYSWNTSAAQALLGGLQEAGIPLRRTREEGLLRDRFVRRLLACYARVLFLAAPLRAAAYLRYNPAPDWDALPARARPALEHCAQNLAQRLDAPGGLDPLAIGYAFLACAPFSATLQQALTGDVRAERRLRRLAVCMQLVARRSAARGTMRLSRANAAVFAEDFFNTFLPFLQKAGYALDYADEPEEPTAPDGVTLLTIHQSKGLEFSTVLLLEPTRSSGGFPQEAEPLPPAKEFAEAVSPEMAERFDEARRYYTAFTRAKDRLILLSCDATCAAASPFQNREGERLPVAPAFAAINATLPPVSASECAVQPSGAEVMPEAAPSSVPPETIQHAYAYTTDVQPYRHCPRAYFFFRKAGFPQRQTPEATYGTLVHQALQFFHRPEWRACIPTEAQLQRCIQWLQGGMKRQHLPLPEKAEESACADLRAYFSGAGASLHRRAYASEQSVYYSEQAYILYGTWDLLLDDGTLVDFKTGQKPEADSEKARSYRGQLAFYRLLAKKSEGKESNSSGEDLLYFTEEHKAPLVRVKRADAAQGKAQRAEIAALIARMERRDFDQRAPRESCGCCPFCAFCYPKEGEFHA